MFYKGMTMFLCYVNDGIFAGPSSEEIDDAIEQLRKQDFKAEDKGTMQDYLGINIKFLLDGKIRLTQPQIINSILEEVPIAKHLKDKNTPSVVSEPLVCDKRLKKFNHQFHFWQVIGKCNFLEKGTRLDISLTTHLCAWFSEDPREPHAVAV
eukprot:10929011-Ditylum_brightwellii.AAC.1